jgi:transporter family-2 protein
MEIKMGYIFALIGASIVGIAVAIEPTINSGLGKLITPRLATLHSFMIGTLLMIIINLISGGFKAYGGIFKAPPYLWIGGIIGTVVVYVGAKVTTILGVATTLTIMVSVQLLTSMVIDHYGLFGVEKVPMDLSRVAGIALMVIAVKLIVK